MTGTAIRVANAPCSWGVLEFDLKGETAAYHRVLDEMAQAGYTGTELGDWGFLPTDPAALKQELEQRNLSMLAAFVPVNFADMSAHKQGLETALKTARLLSAVSASPFIVLADDNCKDPVRTNNAGRVTRAQGLDGEQWAVFAGGVELIARQVLNQTGVKSVFHHHTGGFVETPDEIDQLLSLTNPLVVGLCLDTGHYSFGGGDPVAALKEYSDRIWHVHFKDCSDKVKEKAIEKEWDYFTSVKNGVFCELGAGNVDFPALVEELNRKPYTGWIVVEQDVLPGMGSPLESARRNREYLNKLGL